MNEGEMVAPALKRSVWIVVKVVVCCEQATGVHTALVGGWWLGGDKNKGACVLVVL